MRVFMNGKELVLAEGGVMTDGAFLTISGSALGPNANAIGDATPGDAVADASGGLIVDSQARSALNALLARLRTLGVIAT